MREIKLNEIADASDDENATDEGLDLLGDLVENNEAGPSQDSNILVVSDYGYEESDGGDDDSTIGDDLPGDEDELFDDGDDSDDGDELSGDGDRESDDGDRMSPDRDDLSGHNKVDLNDFKDFLHKNKAGIIECMKKARAPRSINPYVSFYEL